MSTATESTPFENLREALYRIRLAARALEGIGMLLEPSLAEADEQLNMTQRSEAAAVFLFFGEVLLNEREIIDKSFQEMERRQKLEPDEVAA